MRTGQILSCGVLLALGGAWRPDVTAGDARGGAERAPAAPPAPLAYDVATYELAPHLRAGGTGWTLEEAKRLLAQRVDAEKRRRELRVYYYRIGHMLAFPLPLAQRPSERLLPEGIPGISYPWTTWLSWELEERWRILHAGWRLLGDANAGDLLQRELAALSGWEHLGGAGGQVSLVTGHLAGCLSLALADASGWDSGRYREALGAARSLLERDLWRWFEKTWGDGKPLTAARLHNIPTIALVRGAQLARVINSSHLKPLEARARDALHAWCQFRTGPERHTEGTAYDGYLADAMTEWLAGLPHRDAELLLARGAFHSVVEEWVQLSLPGRADLHAPLGDVEPEMPFWVNALMRLARWYELPGAGWLLCRYPLQRFPAAALAAIPDHAAFLERRFPPPAAGPREHLAAVSLRTGWESRDLLAAVGLPRCNMGHLHDDGGHVVVGWQGRFWITDPGYQQYRAGAEREYTLGPQAHNAPGLGGPAPPPPAARLLSLRTDPAGRQHAALDLTGSYEGIPERGSVRRDVWLVPGEAPAVLVRDRFAGLRPGVEVQTHWLGGTYLAWAFPAGWARLSEGDHALWIGTAPAAVDPGKLIRHAGSRGPLTLRHVASLPEGNGTQWWVFWCDPSLGWESPNLEIEGDVLRIRLPGKTAADWIAP